MSLLASLRLMCSFLAYGKVACCRLNPVISRESGHTRLSTLLFAENSPIVITGSNGEHCFGALLQVDCGYNACRAVVDGHIDVYRMLHLDGGLLTAKEQATNLEHAIQKNLD